MGRREGREEKSRERWRRDKGDRKRGDQRMKGGQEEGWGKWDMRDARGEEACRCQGQEVQFQEDWG